jgi:hypothetical protein
LPSAGWVWPPKVTVPPSMTGFSLARPSGVEWLMPSSPSIVPTVFLRFGAGTSKGSVMKRLRNAEPLASASRYCSSRRSTTSCCSAVPMPCFFATFSAVCSMEWRPSGSQPKFSITQSSATPVPPGPFGFG